MYKCLMKNRDNERGFTFVEAIFQLALYIVFAQLFILVMVWTGTFQNTALTKEHTEWELFINDLINYIASAKQVNVINQGQGIQIVQYSQTVDVEKYETMIRKRLNGLGHEPMLMDVKKVSFALHENQLILTVIFDTGLQKEREIIVPIY